MAILDRKYRLRNRRLHAESLESRAMMAGDVAHNFLFPQDVDDDGAMTPLDALVVINDLNRGDDSSSSSHFHDVDDDSRVTPLDALIVINALNSRSASAGSSHEQSAHLSSDPSLARVRVELESSGTETELNIRMDHAPASTSLAVSINDIALGQMMTDAKGRGKLVLSQGDDNAAHSPLPNELLNLTPDMELVIGDIVRAKLSNLTSSDDHGGAGGSGGDSSSSSLNLVATFAPVANATASSEYEEESEHGVTKRSFKAEIEGAAPNASVDVIVNDVKVGTIVADSRGKGKLSLSTQPKDAGVQLMSSSFPVVAVNTAVTIGSSSSTFHKSA